MSCLTMFRLANPVFNILSNDSFGDKVKVVSMEMPEINPDEIQSRVEGHELFDDVQIGESEEVDMDNDQENTVCSGPEPSPSPIKIHSYSVLTVKNSNNRIRRASKPSQKMSKVDPSHSKIYSIKTPSVIKLRAKVTQKRKMYEMAPLADPAAGKCRQNALNAKKNRDRKKQELEEAATEIAQLRSENQDLRSEADTVREELAAARRELRELREQMKLSPGTSVDLGNATFPWAL